MPNSRFRGNSRNISIWLKLRTQLQSHRKIPALYRYLKKGVSSTLPPSQISKIQEGRSTRVWHCSRSSVIVRCRVSGFLLAVFFSLVLVAIYVLLSLWILAVLLACYRLFRDKASLCDQRRNTSMQDPKPLIVQVNNTPTYMLHLLYISVGVEACDILLITNVPNLA